jgi:hypothetical protein
MGIPFVAPIDLQGNELQNARLQNLASAPSAAAGLIYYNSSTKLLGVSDGTAWTYLAPSGLDIEAVQDTVAQMVSSSTVVVPTYDDNAGTLIFTIGAGQITNSMVATNAAISADKTVAGTTNGVYTLTEKSKLAGVASGATANSTDAQLRDRSTHTGTQSADTLTAGSTNGVYTLAEKTKLSGVAAGATANSTDAVLLARANHTGTQSADTVIDGTTNKAYTAIEKTKLAGVATGATANSPDATLLSRANHTGTQTASTISDFTSAVNSIVQGVVGAAPTALDTLQELAAALGNDANFASTVTNSLAQKANISSLAAVATSGTYASLTAKPVYVATIGDGTATSYVVTHALGTQNIQKPSLRLAASPYTFVEAQIEATSATTVTVRFGSAPSAGQYVLNVTAV